MIEDRIRKLVEEEIYKKEGYVRKLVEKELSKRRSTGPDKVCISFKTDEERVRVAVKGRQGEHWSTAEDKMLESEELAAISQIAINHRRSIGAIKSRLNHLRKQRRENYHE